MQYFAPDYELDVRPSNMDNANTKDYLEKIRTQVVENLKRTSFAPSVQMTDVPRGPLVEGMDDEADAILDDLDEDENKDKRMTSRRFDQYVEKPGELSDSEDEEESAAVGVRRQPNALKRRNEINYKHLDLGDSGLESGLATPRDASSIADEEADLAGDARMTEAPDEETEVPAMPLAAEPPSRAEEAESSEMAVDKQEESAAPSAPLSHQPSPKPQDEDTAMEDAQAPAAEPEKPREVEPSAKQEEQEKPVEEVPATIEKAPTPLPTSPPKEQSPPKEAPVAKEPSHAEFHPESTEPAKEAESTEATEPAKGNATEAPADEPLEKTEPEKAEPTGAEAAGQVTEQKTESTGPEATEATESPKEAPKETGESGETENKPEEQAKSNE